MDYYRKTINKVVNDIKLKMQLSALTLKLSENNKKIDDLIVVDKNIKKDVSSNLGKINNNSSTISTNSGQINTNTGDISDNLNQINTNTENISDNLNQINTNTENISNNLNQINTNTENISDNLNQINTNTGDISTNSGQINTNTENISNNSNHINTNTENISNNSGKIDNFTQYILKSGKDFEEKYIIEKEIFRFNKDKHFYTMFEKEIEFDFTKNSLLFVKNHMYYKYENLSNDYYRLQHEYNIYDEDNLIHKYLFNKDTYYDESLDPILHTNEDFCICFKENYNKIKINLQLHRHNRHGYGNINLEIDDDNENYINIDYVDRNNKPTQYLKNIYNILFYDEKTQIDFEGNNFYEKVFDIDSSKNDFIEIKFKISLEYEDISERAYVKTFYELFDENDNSLYIKSVSNNDYSYYSNKIFIDENIFYNFTKNIKKLKLVIKFQNILFDRVINIFYIKNDNYRFILKHYST